MGQDRPVSNVSPLRRHPTRVPGLDGILGGGLLAGDTYLISGMPGTGKTTLGNQMAFTHASHGGNVLFATLMTESHDHMLAHMQKFSFFDHTLVGTHIQYISVTVPMQEGDLEHTLRLLVDALRDHRATFLVLDGAGAARLFAQSDLDYLRFIHGLDARTAVLGCTTVLLASEQEEHVIATHVDGVIQLTNRSASARDTRWLRVAKLRGSDYVNGQHRFAIDADGLSVFPRIEAAEATVSPTWHEPQDRLALGIDGLDQMIAGGVQEGSSTLILGTPGAGKTLIGLHYLVEGTRNGERGLFAGFHEPPQALASTAERAGMQLRPHIESGLVRVLWQPPLEFSPDQWAWKLLAEVEEHRPRRLVIDNFGDLIPLFTVPERRSFFAPALVNQLRDRGVTSLILLEIDAIAGRTVTVPIENLTATLDNGILLRTVEAGSALHRTVSILKQRQTNFDTTIREFTVGPNGVTVGDAYSLVNSSAAPFPYTT